MTNIQKQLKTILNDPKKVRNLKTDSGKTLEQILKDDAEKLIDILQDEIDKLYLRPEGWYTRSNDLKNSIDKSISIDPKTNTISIGFNDLAWHESYITKTYNPNYSKQSYVPQAIRGGFEVFDSGHHFEGVDFIQNAVDRFNRVKHKGIIVKIIDDDIAGNWVK